MQRKILLVMLSIAFAGCKMVGPNYERPQVSLPEQFQEVATQESAQSAISIQWWELYQDKTLTELIAKARSNNTDIRLAVARIEEADAYLREVGAALLPQVDLNSSASRSRISELGATPLFNGIPPVRENYNLRLGTTFELDFWGKLRRAKESARAQTLSSHYAKSTVELSLEGLVASQYFLLRSLEAQIKISNDSLNSRKNSLALTQRKLEAGIVSGLDVYQAEYAQSNLAAHISELEQQRAIAEHQLGVLTGDMSLKVLAGDINTLPVPPVPPVGLPSSLLEARPDIRQAEQQMVAANANIGVAKAALFPSISLTAYYGGESADLSNILKSAARIWNGGLSLNLPIFDSGKLKSRVDQASAKQKQALISYEASIQAGFKEVNDALISVRKTSEREVELNRSLEASSNALKIAQNRYKSGYSAYLDVLESQRAYNDASTAFIQCRQARLSASVDLFKALGGGWKTE